MTVTSVLLDILVVLVAAKLAAEISERIGIPAVVGEILAGIIIGGSALHLVGDDEVLRILAELGVILLLVEVGMEMDPAELMRVGRPALLVATVGVVLPFVGGYAIARALGVENEAALFLGAGLTATSVGITARVFGDLKALALVEARTVLGAAVADDVIGLVILTVIAGIATGAEVSVVAIGRVAFIAIAVLTVSALAGSRAAPWIFERVGRFSRSTGTLVAIALAFVLVFSLLAEAAGLAPIIGAFVAGIALARSTEADRIRRELAPVGHLFIPVFFLQIGMDVRLQEFFDRGTLILAAALLAVAVVGKLLAGPAAIGLKADKTLIGLGMLPRGEVGLIFAGLGLREGVLGQDAYGSLLFVVFATTLAAPPLLRSRLKRRHATVASQVLPTSTVASGPLTVARGIVEQTSEIPPGRELTVALDAAMLVAKGNQPGPVLLERLGGFTATSLRWNERSIDRFFDVLLEGSSRSWRFLETSGVLDRVLPELAEVLRLRKADPFELDVTRALRWSTLEELHRIVVDDPAAQKEFETLDEPRTLLISALALDAARNNSEAVKLGRRLSTRLALGARVEQGVALLCAEADLFQRAGSRVDALDEVATRQMAAHLRRSSLARALYLLTLAQGELDAVKRARVDELHALIQEVLSMDSPGSTRTMDLVERLRNKALGAVGSSRVLEGWVRSAPADHLLSASTSDVVRHVGLLETAHANRRLVSYIDREEDGRWRIEIASPDRTGLLASTTGVLTLAGLDVSEALITTWPDRTAFQSFKASGPRPPAPDDLELAVERARQQRVAPAPIADAKVRFHEESSPWVTRCDIESADHQGVLHALASAISSSDVDIRAARVSVEGGRVVDRFDLVTSSGKKVPPGTQELIQDRIRNGAPWGPGSGKRSRLGGLIKSRNSSAAPLEQR